MAQSQQFLQSEKGSSTYNVRDAEHAAYCMYVHVHARNPSLTQKAKPCSTHNPDQTMHPSIVQSYPITPVLASPCNTPKRQTKITFP